jgi:Ca2+-binding EF-hand superfamily protein
MRVALRALGKVKLSEKDISKLISDVNVNGDDRVTMEEFKAAFVKRSATWDSTPAAPPAAAKAS